MYELMKWTDNSAVEWNTDKEVSLQVNAVPLDETEAIFQNVYYNENNSHEGINANEIRFSHGVKSADKKDYVFASMSGLLSDLLYSSIISKAQIDVENNVDINNPEDLKALLTKVWGLCGISAEIIQEKTSEAESILQDVGTIIHNASSYKEMAKDFADDLSFRGLIVSIVEQITGIEFGLDEEGKFVINQIPENLRMKGIHKALCKGVLIWVLREAYEYKKTGKFQKEKDDILRFIDGTKLLRKIVKEIAVSPLFVSKTFNFPELEGWVTDQVNNYEWDDLNLGTAIVWQTVPVLFNKIMVRAYWFLRRFSEELFLRNVKSLEGLAYIDLIGDKEQKQRVILRMETVSLGVFAALNVSYSISQGFKKYNETEDVASGISSFIAGINFVNLFELVAVVRKDAQFIIEDIKDILTGFNEVKRINPLPVNNKIRELYTGLNKVESRILYSLELHYIEEDIKRTVDNTTQVRKDAWKKQWMKICSESLNQSKLFDDEPEKVYAALETHASTAANNDWLYRIVLELSLFKPYFALEINDSDNEEFKGLKPSKINYLKEYFVTNQKSIDEEDIDRLIKNFEKQYAFLDGKQTKKAAGVIGALVVGVAAAGAAFVFAPAIAVALLGGAFQGLHGIALVNACLAALGGGALAAGGLGIAGGTLVIAGGGAVLGLSASGAAATAMILLSSPEFVKTDYAKLLTNCEYVMIGKYKMFSEVSEIRNIINNDYSNLYLQLLVLQDRLFNGEIKEPEKYKEANQLLKSWNESYKIMGRTIKALDKMLG